MFGIFDPHFSENGDDQVLTLLGEISSRYAEARKQLVEDARKLHEAQVNLCEEYGELRERVVDEG
jgi:hypothetical protein